MLYFLYIKGSGKTTIVKKLIKDFNVKSIATQGFFTEEVRDINTNDRIGFDIESFDGKRAILARDGSRGQSHSKTRLPKVGKYSIHLLDFERIALPILQNRQLGTVLVIDEIGKMELFSNGFTKEIERLILDIEKKQNIVKLIATVPINSQVKVVDRLKNVSNVKLFNVTKSNRDDLYDEIFSEAFEYVQN